MGSFQPVNAQENVIGGLRKKYNNTEEPTLFEQKMKPNPFEQFASWFAKLIELKAVLAGDVNAVAVSTVGSDNKPSSRMVLLKGYSENGFTFFTNSVSQKGREMSNNPYASMLFYWPNLDRQVRIDGVVVNEETSVADEYWKSRPIGSRIGSKISQQSAVIPSREYLEEKQKQLEKLVEEQGESVVSRPETWLGYTLKPTKFEFWQGQSNRIHDRLVYEKSAEGVWSMRRLSP